MTDFVPVNRLEELLVEAATNPAARPDFYRELLRADLFVVTPDAPDAEGSTQLAAGATLSLVSWQGPSGPYTPIFSSRERVDEVAHHIGREMGFVALQGSALFGMLTQVPQPAVLNPGFAFGKQLVPDEIRRLADGTIFQPHERRVFEKATQVLLGQPAAYPQELVDALTRLFRGRPSVEAAYVAQIQIPGEDAPHPIVGLVSSDAAKDIADAGLVAKELGRPSPVDFLPLNASSTDGLAQYFRGTKPFYERTTSTP